MIRRRHEIDAASRAAVVLAAAFAITACDAPAPTGPASSATSAAAATPSGATLSSPTMTMADAPGAREPITFSNTFPGDDPCTPTYDPEEHTTTISGTIWIQNLPSGDRVIHWERTITTDSGYEGHGRRTVVTNGNVFKLTNMDVVSHPDGRTFLARGVRVVDLTTDPATTRVERGEFICIRD